MYLKKEEIILSSKKVFKVILFKDNDNLARIDIKLADGETLTICPKMGNRKPILEYEIMKGIH